MVLREAQPSDTVEAEHLTDIPNLRQKGSRLRIWLAPGAGQELLVVPDRSTLKGSHRTRSVR